MGLESTQLQGWFSNRRLKLKKVWNTSELGARATSI
jgi:hypothetical protein